MCMADRSQSSPILLHPEPERISDTASGACCPALDPAAVHRPKSHPGAAVKTTTCQEGGHQAHSAANAHPEVCDGAQPSLTDGIS